MKESEGLECDVVAWQSRGRGYTAHMVKWWFSIVSTGRGVLQCLPLAGSKAMKLTLPPALAPILSSNIAGARAAHVQGRG